MTQLHDAVLGPGGDHWLALPILAAGAVPLAAGMIVQIRLARMTVKFVAPASSALTVPRPGPSP